MAIVKTKIKDKNFLQIDKTGIEDNRLSWAATGLLTYLIGRPKDWSIVIEHLKNVKTNGRDGTRNALNELRKFNYCHFFQIKNKGMIVDTVYLVFENPTSPEEAMKEIQLEKGEAISYQKYKGKTPLTEKPFMDKNIENRSISPYTEKPSTEKPNTENPTLLIIDTTNNRITNKRTTTNDSSSDFLKNDILNKEVYRKLLKYSLNLSTIKNVLNLYNTTDLAEERIFEVLEMAKEKSWGDGAIYKALKENWNLNKEENPIISEEEIKNNLKSLVNYYIEFFINGNDDFISLEQILLSKINKISGISQFENLKNEYLEKFRNYCKNYSKEKREDEIVKNVDDKKNEIEFFDTLSIDAKNIIEEIARKKYLIAFPETNFELLKNMSESLYMRMLKPYIQEAISKNYDITEV